MSKFFDDFTEHIREGLAGNIPDTSDCQMIAIGLDINTVIESLTLLPGATTMSPIPNSSIGSPISDLPCDILREIFTHCLPQPSLDSLQPRPTIAPILLCHICSSWRTVALASPILWARLYYYFTMLVDDDTDSAPCTIAFNECEIEFIQWWRTNHGSVAPFLCLGVNDDEDYDVNYLSNKPVVDGGMDFLLEYITSAQYLELDSFFWTKIHEKINAGYQVAFPNLHTLLTESDWAKNDSFYHIQSLISTQTHLTLRCLSTGRDAPPDHFTIPNHWSTLTHISLSEVSVSLEFWFSLTRTVPSLRWGHFEFITLTSIDYIMPPQCTLPQLSTLSVAVRGALADRSVFPLSLLFTGLHLPTLHTLSLSSSLVESWKDKRAITELYCVLNSTPAITKLALEGNFLSLDWCDTGVLLAAMGNVGPVWKHATQLAHLQLTIPYITLPTYTKEKEISDIFVGNILSSDNIWLDLQNLACPIRIITICTASLSTYTRDFTMLNIPKNAPKAPAVTFHLTSDTADTVATKVRNEWYSII